MFESFLIWFISWILYIYGFIMLQLTNNTLVEYAKNPMATEININNSSEIYDIIHFYVEDIISDNNNQFKMAQSLIKQSIPIKLTFRDEKNIFNGYNDYFQDNSEYNNSNNTDKTKLIVKNLEYNGKDFHIFAKNLINEYPLGLLQFSGNYIAGGAHSDISPACYNFYYVKRGEKNGYILPPKMSNYVDLDYEQHSIIPSITKNNIKNDNWLNNIPYYYSFNLKQNQIIVFNNCDCIHYFENILNNNNNNIYPISYSLRFTNRNRYSWSRARTNYCKLIKSKEIARVAYDGIINGQYISYRAR